MFISRDDREGASRQRGLPTAVLWELSVCPLSPAAEAGRWKMKRRKYSLGY